MSIPTPPEEPVTSGPSGALPLRGQTRCRQRGVALIIVLSALVLLSGLMIAFFMSVSTERSSAKTFAENNEARKLADTALNLVIAQIKDATVGTGTTGWMSQPGLIRTYSPTGSLIAAYKLYSSANMRGDDKFDPANTDKVPTDWYANPAIYTDLNAPVTSGTADIYPILDASALALPDADKIKGFDISGAPLDTGSNANQAPMPVQWLYVLQNGEIMSAHAGGATADSVTLDGTASASNPIIGRVAFWTDDETCKVNINTAAGDLWNNTTDFGSYCDMPYVSGSTEIKLRDNQPVQHEYQRYPGHPATTYLSAVFPNLWPTAADRSRIYDIVPRITYTSGAGSTVDVSSKGGTVKTNATTAKATIPCIGFSDGDHLYSSVDELQFAVTHAKLSGISRPTNIATSTSSITPRQVQQGIFFLTAQSRAPDLNLFGKPRIGMWPEGVDDNGTLNGTAFDKTIAYCSTLKSGNTTKEYFFRRNDSTSPRHDYDNMPRNQALYAYMQALTSGTIPGFGGSFAAKYQQNGVPNERDQILTEIFDYIRASVNLVDTTGTAAPYTGVSNTSSKNSRNNPPGTGHVVPIQIITASGTTCGFGRSQTLYTPNLLLLGLNTNVVSPPSSSASSGSGTLISGTWGYSDNGQPRDKIISYKLATTKVQAVFLINSFSVGEGVVRAIPNLVYEVSGLDGIYLHGANMGFPATGIVDYNCFTPNQDYASGGFSGAGSLFYDSTLGSGLTVRSGSDSSGNPAVTTLTSNGSSDNTKYPFWSKPVSLPNLVSLRDGTKLPNIAGAEFKSPLELEFKKPITMKIYTKDKKGKVDASKGLLQTITLDFKNTQIPTPICRGGGAVDHLGAKVTDWKESIWYEGGHFHVFTGSVNPFSRNTDGTMINGAANGWAVWPDSSRGLVPMGKDVRGDMRLVAANPNVDSSVFVPADAYYMNSVPYNGSKPSCVWNYNYNWGIGSPKVDDKRTDDVSDGMQAGFDRANTNGGWPGFPGSLVGDVKYNINAGSNSNAPSFKGGTTMFYPDPNQSRPFPMKMPDGSPLTNEALLLGSDKVSYRPGDWDTAMLGIGCVDGPFVNKADEGETGPGAYNNYNSNMSISTLFSPNRQVPSPVIFGSLSTGVKRGLPWQTLLFCPNPPAMDSHPGWGKSVNGTAGPNARAPFRFPPDHLLLDLFHMPVVEPYAISEPFSTAGKINLNYQIAPFTYIKRNTGLQAILRSTRVNAIPTTDGTCYRAGTPSTTYRKNVDIDETLKGFDDRFSQNRPFRSASEICEMFLVPTGETLGNVSDLASGFWSKQKLTGDNLREKPYSQIYSRLTTKSNSYTVHVRVQALKKVSSDPKQNEWNQQKDRMVGEYRGSFIIERFLDPNDPELVKFDESKFDAIEYDTDNITVKKSGQLDPFYKFRIVSTKKFAP